MILDLVKIRPNLKKNFENKLQVCEDAFTQEYLIEFGDFVNNDMNYELAIQRFSREDWKLPLYSYIINKKIIHQSSWERIKHGIKVKEFVEIIFITIVALFCLAIFINRQLSNISSQKHCFESFDGIVCR